MPALRHVLLPLLGLSLLAGTAAAQRGEKAQVLVPPGKSTQNPPPPPAPVPQPLDDRPVNLPGAQAAEDTPNPNAPRPLQAMGAPPFRSDRPLLEVNGVAITAFELNELVNYFQSWRPGSPDLLLRDAVAALIPRAAVQARYADALPAMKEKIGKARAGLSAGQEWAAVVKDYSDDDEAPTPDGSYELRRGRAVQPFDRLCHSGTLDEITEPFLTQYGYHVLQITGYTQALDPREDVSKVRHVLVMFPFQGEPREEIAKLAQDAKIRVLEPGIQNVLPPEYRDQIVP